MTGAVSLTGEPPYRLGVAQTATVQPHTNNGVTVTIGALIEGLGPKPVLIDIQMSDNVALELVGRLARALEMPKPS